MVHGGLKAFEEEGSAQKTENIQNITYKKNKIKFIKITESKNTFLFACNYNSMLENTFL